MVRDLGKKKEKTLFKTWGGKPTTKIFRHCESGQRVMRLHLHQKLKMLIPNLELPTPEEEQADPNLADEVYETCVSFLREKTRDRKKFSLVFEENCNYGFRRNLWAMKPLGIIISIIGVVILAIPTIVTFFKEGQSPSLLLIGCGLGNLFLLGGWLWWFTPNWVKTSADAYAERLLASCDRL